jgi:hypothetical protein
MNEIPDGALSIDANLSIAVGKGQIRVLASFTDPVIRVSLDNKAIDASRTITRRLVLAAADTCRCLTGKTIEFDVESKPFFRLQSRRNLLGFLLGLRSGARFDDFATTWRVVRGR